MLDIYFYITNVFHCFQKKKKKTVLTTSVTELTRLLVNVENKETKLKFILQEIMNHTYDIGLINIFQPDGKIKLIHCGLSFQGILKCNATIIPLFTNNTLVGNIIIGNTKLLDVTIPGSMLEYIAQVISE